MALLLAATCSSIVFAKPLPLDFHDIERRWSEGQSEAEIHPAKDIREATPSWTIARTSETATAVAAVTFDSTTDERTMHERTRFQKRDTNSALMTKMRKFVEDFYRRRGTSSMISPREPEEAPVLKPRKGMRYRYAR
ncbi:hypothetical protein LTR35_017083 [Friedmanniomyces endolithicus]|nr:hypothetical protein LTR35_017083 [Friedmanniomyces endolithicus]KAK0295292.1 hypothetical protein LTS00_005922 [Friedmanniomyces endolithicus]KAK0983146.1 hypothetical protein LTR54_014401 [Friedmanniomyces endolithicus]